MHTFVRFLIRFMIVTILIVAVVAVVVFAYTRRASFGKAPDGDRLARMEKSPHYRDGKFHNLSFTPDLTEGYSYPGVLWDFLFTKFPRTAPVAPIPSRKTDLHTLPAEKDLLVWFGHSSYYMQLSGKRFLVDPVFSGNASPLPGTNKAFSGADIYSVSDIPPIDYLLITHDHYDHIDYETIIGLRNKVKKIICGLGVGAHLEHWGFPTEMIIENDWYEAVTLDSGFVIHTEPARHFSGRLFSRNNTLWVSFVVQTPSSKIYVGGDSGYDNHFADIGKRHGEIDIAILDNGQYNLAWQAIHMMPDEVLRATAELNAKRLFPVHSSKFKMANHPWDEPLRKITDLNANKNIPMMTPIIGELVHLGDSTQTFSRWWEGME